MLKWKNNFHLFFIFQIMIFHYNLLIKSLVSFFFCFTLCLLLHQNHEFAFQIPVFDQVRNLNRFLVRAANLRATDTFWFRDSYCFLDGVSVVDVLAVLISNWIANLTLWDRINCRYNFFNLHAINRCCAIQAIYVFGPILIQQIFYVIAKISDSLWFLSAAFLHFLQQFLVTY